MVDVLYDDRFLLLFFKCVGCVWYSVWLVKLCLLLLVSMTTNWTCWQFLELIPVVHSFVATCPSFFCIVENRLSTVVMTGFVTILSFIVIFQTSWTFASELALRIWHLVFWKGIKFETGYIIKLKNGYIKLLNVPKLSRNFYFYQSQINNIKNIK